MVDRLGIMNKTVQTTSCEQDLCSLGEQVLVDRWPKKKQRHDNKSTGRYSVTNGPYGKEMLSTGNVGEAYQNVTAPARKHRSMGNKPVL